MSDERGGFQEPASKLNLMLSVVGLAITLLGALSVSVAKSQDTQNRVTELLSARADHESRIRGVEATCGVVQTALTDIKDRLQRIERKLDGSK